MKSITKKCNLKLKRETHTCIWWNDYLWIYCCVEL